MPATRLKRFLEENHVPFKTIPHYTTYTAQETAASAHVHGREFAKTVMVQIGGETAMVVLPAHKKLHLERLRKLTGRWDVELMSEREFKDQFSDCDAGAMPPFGQLYGMKVYADMALAGEEQIAFNAGTHDEIVQIAYHDFERLVQPTLGELAFRPGQPVA